MNCWHPRFQTKGGVPKPAGLKDIFQTRGPAWFGRVSADSRPAPAQHLGVLKVKALGGGGWLPGSEVRVVTPLQTRGGQQEVLEEPGIGFLPSNGSAPPGPCSALGLSLLPCEMETEGVTSLPLTGLFWGGYTGVSFGAEKGRWSESGLCGEVAATPQVRGGLIPASAPVPSPGHLPVVSLPANTPVSPGGKRAPGCFISPGHRALRGIGLEREGDGSWPSCQDSLC